MLSLAAALQGLVVNGPALPASAAARASAPVMMPIERIPGEGDPFQNGNMRRAEEIATKQPRGISTTEANLQYIETEDEPWCAAAPSGAPCRAEGDSWSSRHGCCPLILQACDVPADLADDAG